MNKFLGIVPLLINTLANHTNLSLRLFGKQKERINKIEDQNRDNKLEKSKAEI